MSNQEFHIPTPAEAQGQAQAAIEYAIATGMGHVEPRKINDKGVVTRATAVAGEGMFSEDYEVSYEDCGLTSDADEPSPYRDTVAHAYTPNGSLYSAKLSTSREPIRNLRNSQASVERPGYGIHEFSEEHKLTAAALITVLAARRIYEDAATWANRKAAEIEAANATYATRMKR